MMAIPRSKVVAEGNKEEQQMDYKNAYAQNVEARLDQWRAEIDKLQAQADEASANAQLNYQKEIDDLRDGQEQAQRKLYELGQAQGAAWKDLKSGVESAWDDLGKAVRSASDRFS